MKKFLFILIQIGVVCCVQAQFAGGSGHGNTRLYNDAISLAGEDLSILFSGGSGNGQTKSGASFSILPITLLRFEGRPDGNAALLQWSAISDPGEHFEVQRSTSTGQWQTLAQVNGTGDGQQVKQYSFNDTRPTARLHYYRLALLHNGGSTTYSSTVPVSFTSGEIRVYPTVTKDQITIYRPEGGITQLLIWNAQGQLVERKLLQGGTQQVSLSHLSAGVYLLQVAEGQRLRVVKQ